MAWFSGGVRGFHASGDVGRLRAPGGRADRAFGAPGGVPSRLGIRTRGCPGRAGGAPTGGFPRTGAPGARTAATRPRAPGITGHAGVRASGGVRAVWISGRVAVRGAWERLGGRVSVGPGAPGACTGSARPGLRGICASGLPRRPVSVRPSAGTACRSLRPRGGAAAGWPGGPAVGRPGRLDVCASRVPGSASPGASVRPCGRGVSGVRGRRPVGLRSVLDVDS